jgi:hypothetical protein
MLDTGIPPFTRNQYTDQVIFIIISIFPVNKEACNKTEKFKEKQQFVAFKEISYAWLRVLLWYREE